MVAGTGEAPSGLVAYESDNLPDDYRGNLLVTSWGDHRIERYRLAAARRLVPLDDGAGGRRRRGLPAGRHRHGPRRLGLLQRLGRQVLRPARQGPRLAAAHRDSGLASHGTEARGEPRPSRPAGPGAGRRRAGRARRGRLQGPGSCGRVEPRHEGQGPRFAGPLGVREDEPRGRDQRAAATIVPRSARSPPGSACDDPSDHESSHGERSLAPGPGRGASAARRRCGQGHAPQGPRVGRSLHPAGRTRRAAPLVESPGIDQTRR